MKRSGNALRRVAAGIAMVAAVAWTGLAETVTNVRGVQRENSKLVDIYYDLNATDYGTYTVGVEIEGRMIAVNASTFTGDVGEGVTPGTNRHILWDAGTDWPNKKGDVKAIVTATKEDPTVSHGKVQLWEGGPYWADRNIGADAPWEAGLYFWWGDTTGHRPSGTTFGFDFSRNNSAIYTYKISVQGLQSAGWVTSDGVLAPAHDAAHVKWGGSWRMPTHQELKDLCYNKCDWTWTTTNGVNGDIVRGRDAYSSNSIFLPAAGLGDGTLLSGVGWWGCYWSSSPDPRDNYFYTDPYWGTDSIFLNFYSSSHNTAYGSRNRGGGYPVRPVQGFTN